MREISSGILGNSWPHFREFLDHGTGIDFLRLFRSAFNNFAAEGDNCLRSGNAPRTLVHTNGQQVADWLREAWPQRQSYPREVECYALSIAINTIVDRANARGIKDQGMMSAKARREILMEVRRLARSTQTKLLPLLDPAISLNEKFESCGPFVPPELVTELSALEAMQHATSDFLKLPTPPKPKDHLDPVLWLELKTRRAWQSVVESDPAAGDAKVRFGNKEGDPLVEFITLALNGIGLLAGSDNPYSHSTVSEHLRKRHNRPRNRAKGRLET